MATIERFEDLEIWQKARILTKRVFILSKKEKFSQDYRFMSQILSSSGSVMDNIAEGFERGGNNEFKQFLSIAKGSAGETRSQIYRAYDFEYISEDDFEELIPEYENLSGKIKNFINYLQNSEIRGIKFKKD